MTTDRDVLVVGATGNVGLPLVERLAEAGASVRAATTDPQRAAGRVDSRAEPVRFDFTDTRTWWGALNGVGSMFLLRPPHLSNVADTLVPVVRAAKSAGVRRVVFLSVQGAERNPLLPHRAVERHLIRSGPEWTFLRAGYFMQNLAEIHAEDIARRDRIVVPAGRGSTAFVDVRDVAEVAKCALLEPGHVGSAYVPTGARALTYYDVAEVLTTELGRPVRYTEPGPVAYWRHARRSGMSPAMAAVTLGIYTAARFGLASGTTADVRRVTGHDPVSFRRFAQDHRATWIAE